MLSKSDTNLNFIPNLRDDFVTQVDDAMQEVIKQHMLYQHDIDVTESKEMLVLCKEKEELSYSKKKIEMLKTLLFEIVASCEAIISNIKSKKKFLEKIVDEMNSIEMHLPIWSKPNISFTKILNLAHLSWKILFPYLEKYYVQEYSYANNLIQEAKSLLSHHYQCLEDLNQTCIKSLKLITMKFPS